MNFHGYNNSRKRRCERRKKLQETYDTNVELKKLFNTDIIKSEISVKPARPILSLNRKAMDRVEKALSVRDTPIHDNFNNCVLPEVALYSTKTKSRRRLESGGVSARV